MDFSATPAVPATLPRPDARGHFGPFGGRFVPETLMQPLIELEEAYRAAKADVSFMAEFERLLREYANRPTPLYRARNLERALGGAMRIYLKREDLLHTGAHKINNTLGQALLAKRMGKKRLIAETGAGQHGVATATAAALLGFECEVFMGEEDMERQALNVFRMRLMGARVTKVTSGSRTLKDATNEAMRNWMSTVSDTHYIIGSVLGPHPFPLMVRDFQSAIGIEARAQILAAEGRLPDDVVACIGGGSNAMGIFHAFFEDRSVRLWGAEAAGEGLATGKHAATITSGSLGVFHGTRSLVLQSNDGQILPAHSISAGLDYPGVGPEHAFYAASKRATYVAIDDTQALEALELLARTEGILSALESAHALAQLAILAKTAAPESVAVLCLSGRGDKDVFTIKDRLAK